MSLNAGIETLPLISVEPDSKVTQLRQICGAIVGFDHFIRIMQENGIKLMGTQ